MTVVPIVGPMPCIDCRHPVYWTKGGLLDGATRERYGGQWRVHRCRLGEMTPLRSLIDRVVVEPPDPDPDCLCGGYSAFPMHDMSLRHRSWIQRQADADR